MKQFIVFTALFISIGLLFQNCNSDVEYLGGSQGPQLQGTSGGLDTDTTANSPNDSSSQGSLDQPQDVVTDNATSPETIVIDRPQGSVSTPITENIVINREVNFDQCLAYEELINDGSEIVLPPKNSNGICFYIKVLDAIPLHKSGTMGETRDTEVLSSNHDGDFNTYVTPYSLGDTTVHFNNSAGYQMSLSGAFDDPKVKLAIDNYFLVQFEFGTPTVQLNSAFGTADAEPGRGALPILYKDLELSFASFAPGGTAFVEAIGLKRPSTTGSFDHRYRLRLRALDCGGSAELKDVYLVFH